MQRDVGLTTCRFGGCSAIAVAPESLPHNTSSCRMGDAAINAAVDGPIMDAGSDGGIGGADAKNIEVASLDADTDAPRDGLFDGGENPGSDLLPGNDGMDAGVDLGAGGEIVLAARPGTREAPAVVAAARHDGRGGPSPIDEASQR